MKSMTLILLAALLFTNAAFASDVPTVAASNESQTVEYEPVSAVAPDAVSEKPMSAALQQMVEIARILTEAGGNITLKYLVEISRILTKYATVAA